MANMTLAMDEDTHKKMKKHSEIRWTEVARRAIRQKISEIEVAEKIAAKSRLGAKDIEGFAKKIKKGAARRFAHENSD